MCGTDQWVNHLGRAIVDMTVTADSTLARFSIPSPRATDVVVRTMDRTIVNVLELTDLLPIRGFSDERLLR